MSQSKIFFKNQLNQIVHDLRGEKTSIENLRFVIIPSNANNETPKNTWDEIINWWVLPSSIEIRLTFDQIIDTLSSREGLLPLWIKVKQQDGNLIILNISRRFRKFKEIKEYHKENELMPFIYDDLQDLSYSENLERIGLTRKLLWRFNLTDTEKQVFKNKNLLYTEIKDLMNIHFKSYIYFPPDYNHRKPNEKGYSKLVIKRENSNEFSIIDNIGTVNERIIFTSNNFDTVLNDYLDNELNYKIDGLEIEK